MIRPDHPTLSIVRQCRLALMAKIDRQFLETPFYGVRRMTWPLRAEGYFVNIKRVRRLMRLMGPMPIYRKPRTSVPAKGHKTYPYLLRGLRIARPDQVWCADITYIPLARGFLYLIAIMDWWSRKVLAWRLSNTMDVQFCVDALDEALDRHGPPEIFNTDQGSQFTNLDFTGLLGEAGVGGRLQFGVRGQTCFGLTSRRYQSDKIDHYGRISKIVDETVR
jgi:putative transposase